VADGPYRHLRNPLYLGTILLAVAIGTMASRIGFLVLTVGMILFVYRLILREEANLLRSQGESYRRYFEAVPRLIPRSRGTLGLIVEAKKEGPGFSAGFGGAPPGGTVHY